MAERLDSSASSLMCDEFELNNCAHEKDLSFISNRSDSLLLLPIQSEETLRLMIERERDHMPGDDYLKRLNSGGLELSVRREAFDWIWKACSHYSFGPLCVCLSMNYLDRFLSVYELPEGKAWISQLLAVTCLSLAVKMEEPKVPLSVDLQVGDPKFVFEAKTIQRMELLVLGMLKWRMQALTPCSFIDYFLRQVNDSQCNISISFFSKPVQLILNITRGTDFLEFRPSEIAAAVAICLSRGTQAQAVDIDKTIAGFVYVEKVMLLKCIELINNLSLINTPSSSSNAAAASAAAYAPQSPNGVLEAACLSYKSDELTIGSCPISSHGTPSSKRRKS